MTELSKIIGVIANTTAISSRCLSTAEVSDILAKNGITTSTGYDFARPDIPIRNACAEYDGFDKETAENIRTFFQKRDGEPLFPV